MSGKLDQSLDEILSTTRRSGGRTPKTGPRRTRRTTKPTVAAPVGGVKKTSKGAKTGVKVAPTGPAGGNMESKIMVSNLPKDVNEAMVKEYFVKAVGPIRRVEVSYGPGGVSRGIATIFFSRPESAVKAVETQNGVMVDGKSMKIDVILDARRAATIPQPKTLGDRITGQPKAQPKSAATTKGILANRAKSARGRGGKAKNARPAKKTAEELDSEMVDYFGGAATDTNGTAAVPPATNGDATMDDEIL
ncbi:putative mRNA export protein mlo3 [Amylocarpus encephaloides]|uniref:mRNA export protein mlo3 n=1 Tax=Amylocarpus encephaloides TaxID=45428 RepID=A0A9P7YSV8_9HELO|nr:putative mRNA export protein mlo3 [Amylocarpus encephaloides]